MHKIRVSAVAAMSLVIAFGFFFISCATSSTRNRGSLSDAMEKARDDHGEDRDVPDGRRDGGFWHRGERDPERDQDRARDQGAEGEDDRPADTAAGPSLQLSDLVFGLRAGDAFAEGSDIVTSLDGEVFVGGPLSERMELDLFVGFKAAAPEDGSDLDASVRDPIVFLKGAFEGRFTPFPKATYFSPYLLGGFGGYFMVWSFENPLEAGDEKIENDSLGGLLLSAGVGVYLVRTKRLRLGIGIIGDSYLFGAVTSQGFDNDVFGYYNSARIVGEAAFRF